jgi:hypothetical protein
MTKYWNLSLTHAKVAILILSSLRVLGQSAESIISAYFSSVSPNSSFESWREIKSFSAESRAYFSVGDFEGTRHEMGNITYSILLRVWPDKQRETLYSDTTYQTITSDFLFLKGRKIVQVGNLPSFESDLDQSLFFDFFPIKVNEAIKNSSSLRYNGIVKIPGVTTPSHEVELSPKTKGEYSKLYFNPETHLLEAIALYQEDILCILSKYQNFAGFLIPTFVTYLKDKTMYSWKEYRNLKFNIDLPNSKFKRDF